MRTAISRGGVAATDSCFALIEAHQHGKAVGLMNGENRRLNTPYCQSKCKAIYQAPAPHNTCGSCWLGTAQQFYHDNMRGEGESRVTSNIKQGAHLNQPTAWSLPTHAHSHITRAVAAMLFRPYWGSSAWHNRRSLNGESPCVKDPYLPRRVLEVPAPHNKCGRCNWALYVTSPKTCAGKADHGFGVCAPLVLSLSFENSELNCCTA